MDATEARGNTLYSKDMCITSATLKRVPDKTSDSDNTAIVNSEEPLAKTLAKAVAFKA